MPVWQACIIPTRRTFIISSSLSQFWLQSNSALWSGLGGVDYDEEPELAKSNKHLKKKFDKFTFHTFALIEGAKLPQGKGGKKKSGYHASYYRTQKRLEPNANQCSSMKMNMFRIKIRACFYDILRHSPQ
ncbi:hypothetical protein OESDEN_07018 [Oesophagostomum dentatum]|uniref:Uncharacterized protein n=1 Tax=Oesophagostomum dentatum TaxID=61180 RepID=A0A0B1TBA2_OESDE|nr:hypothetical protein OESDEN_07018 [Oesophagostomum dentatum]